MRSMRNAIPDDISCACCLWSTLADEDGMLECRRYPPEVYVLSDGSVLQLRPRMHPSDGCGEHGTYEPDR